MAIRGWKSQYPDHRPPDITCQVRRFKQAYSALILLAALVIASFVGAPKAHAVNVSNDKQELAGILLRAHWEGRFHSITDGTIEQLIVPLAYGRPADAQCGVDLRVLQTLVLTLQQYGSVRVSDINRICPHISTYPPCPTSYQSWHCTNDARAIDFLSAGDMPLIGDSRSLPFLAFLEGFVPGRTQVGQSQCGSGGFSSQYMFRIEDACNHLHVGFAGDGPIRGSGGGQGGTLFEHTTGDGGWQTGNTSLNISGSPISAVDVDRHMPTIVANADGRILHAIPNQSWELLDSGVRVAPGAPISAVYMGTGNQPQIMANDDGRILQIILANDQWQALDTGVRVTPGAPISAVRILDQGWPQVMVNDGGRILQVAAWPEGWKALDTGVRIAPGSPIEAMPTGHMFPQIIANDGGTIVHIGVLDDRWTRMETPIQVPAGTPVAADWVSGMSHPHVFANENGVLMHIGVLDGNWVKLPSTVRMRSGAPITAVAEKNFAPRVYSLD